MTRETQDKYIMISEFIVQRYKLEEVCRRLPEIHALSLIRHCYVCTFEDASDILKLFKNHKG